MVKRFAAILILSLTALLHADNLGDNYKIDDYVILRANTGQFSTGGSYTATSVTYYIYKDDSATELNAGGSSVATEFDSKTGFYLAKVQLTTAAGYEADKTYTVLWVAVVDGVTGGKSDTFRITSGSTVNAFDLPSPEAIANVFSGLISATGGGTSLALDASGYVTPAPGTVTGVALSTDYDAAKTAATQASVNALVTDYLNHGTYGMAALLAAIQVGAGGGITDPIDIWKVDWNDPNLTAGMIGYELMHPAQGLN